MVSKNLYLAKDFLALGNNPFVLRNTQYNKNKIMWTIFFLTVVFDLYSLQGKRGNL